MLDTNHPWAGHSQWRIFTTPFGTGDRFLRAWQAWQRDPQRPGILHVVAQVQGPLAATELVTATAPELRPWAEQLAQRWWGLVPGVHRLGLEGGRVLLTLHVSPLDDALRELSFEADEIHLEDASTLAAREPQALKSLVRLCRRGTRLVAETADGALRHAITHSGFQIGAQASGPGLVAVYDPSWTPRQPRPAAHARAGDCIVIGGGLAGAAAAASLARRGWQVQVLDQAAEPAAGASSLPAGLMAPHLSPDDNLLSRLSRAGLRMTLQQAYDLLEAGEEWQGNGGALEHRQAAKARSFQDEGFAADWSRAATEEDKRAASLPPHASAVVHGRAAWIKPAALVRAWLRHSGIHWRGGVRVERLESDGTQWRVLDASGDQVAQAPQVVIAAALGSAALSGGRVCLQPVRGQVSWGLHPPGLHLPPHPLNGKGHLLPHVPLPQGMAWLSGSSYGRGETDLSSRPQDHQANLERLQTLAPLVARQLGPDFEAERVRAWTGVRCASTDRRPLVGELGEGLWVSTAMGSRGLTFAALCGELVAAGLHGEPLPLPRSLAAALSVKRQRPG